MNWSQSQPTLVSFCDKTMNLVDCVLLLEFLFMIPIFKTYLQLYLSLLDDTQSADSKELDNKKIGALLLLSFIGELYK